MRGIFAGLVPVGPAYTSTKQDVVVPFFSGDVPATTPPYVSTVTTQTGDNINAALPGPFYSATSMEAQPEAFGQQPVNQPPYVSTVTASDIVEEPGLSGTYNPGRLDAINGSPPVTTGLFENLPTPPAYSATLPNS